MKQVGGGLRMVCVHVDEASLVLSLGTGTDWSLGPEDQATGAAWYSRLGL